MRWRGRRDCLSSTFASSLTSGIACSSYTGERIREFLRDFATRMGDEDPERYAEETIADRAAALLFWVAIAAGSTGSRHWAARCFRPASSSTDWFEPYQPPSPTRGRQW